MPEPIKRNVNERVEKLKKDIRQVYSRYDRLTLYEREAPMKEFLKTHRIDGEKGYDQTTFIQYIGPQATQSVGNLKIKEILDLSWSLCVFIHWG